MRAGSLSYRHIDEAEQPLDPLCPGPRVWCWTGRPGRTIMRRQAGARRQLPVNYRIVLIQDHNVPTSKSLKVLKISIDRCTYAVLVLYHKSAGRVQ